MIITEIVPLDKRRSKVFVDEDFAFVLYRGEIKRYQMEEGGDLAEEQYREIVETILYKRAKERILYILKASDKTEREVRKKLEDGGYPGEAIDYAVNFVKEYHYIDDENYARSYLEAYSARKSKRQISYTLQQKGIEKETIAALLDSRPVDEERQIREFLRKKGCGEKPLTREERQKYSSALGRKGFSYESIAHVMGELYDNF